MDRIGKEWNDLIKSMIVTSDHTSDADMDIYNKSGQLNGIQFKQGEQ